MRRLVPLDKSCVGPRASFLNYK